jgi:hypothetical protein
MFFAWPFLMPWYLYRTRGKPGLHYAAATYGIAILRRRDCSHLFNRLNSAFLPRKRLPRVLLETDP